MTTPTRTPTDRPPLQKWPRVPHSGRPAWPTPRTRDERGVAAAFVVLFTVALLTVAGLVIDGGYALAAKREAMNQAEQAARAGADAISAASLRDGNANVAPASSHRSSTALPVRRRRPRHRHDPRPRRHRHRHHPAGHHPALRGRHQLTATSPQPQPPARSTRTTHDPNAARPTSPSLTASVATDAHNHQTANPRQEPSPCA